ncbi:MAG: hypothetical protein ACOCTG_03920 [Bacteroidota bacterium]
MAVLLIGSITYSGLSAAQISKLPLDPADESFFGTSVAVDGQTAAVGASGESICGAVHTFDLDSSTGIWHHGQRLTPSDECVPNQFFGRMVAIWQDVLVVSSGGEFFATERPNTVYVFERRENGQWRETARLSPADSDATRTFGASVDVDAGRILVTAAGDRMHGRYSGSAYVYERNSNGGWTQSHVIVPAGEKTEQRHAFGVSGALDGNRIIVGAPSVVGSRTGAVYLFEFDETASTWLQRARFDGFSSATLSVDVRGDFAIAGDHEGGMMRRGEARLLVREASGAWRVQQRLIPSVSSQSGGFGMEVGLMHDRALVVGFDEQLDQPTNIDRVVFVFVAHSEGRWLQRHVVDIGEPDFGSALSTNHSLAIVGRSGVNTAGAAYVIHIH